MNKPKSEEHKKKLSIALTGRVPWNKGKKRQPFSDEWKNNISIAVKGKSAGDKHYNYGKHLSDETKSKMSVSLKGHAVDENHSQRTSEMNKKKIGDKNPNWLGGVTPFYERLRTSLVYRQWRKTILKRDKCCVLCSTGQELEVDHIKQFAILLVGDNITTLEQARDCEKIWELNNGRVLCKSCHKTTPTYSNRQFRKTLCKY